MITTLTISFIISILVLLIGLIVIKSNIRNKINQYFLLLTIFAALWIIFYALSIYESDSLMYLRLTNIFGSFGVVYFLCFVFIYPGDDFPRVNKLINYLTKTLAIIFAPIVMFTTWVVPGIKSLGGKTIPEFGVLAWPFFMTIYIYLVIGVLTLAYKYIKTYHSDKLQRHKLKIMIFGVGITAISIALMSFSGLIDENMSWFIDTLTPLVPLVFISLTSYGILRGGLFDVRMAVVRSVTYAMVIATLAGLYTITTLVLSSLFRLGDSSPIELVSNVVISLVLVFLFQPLRRFFDRITNEIFYKDNYDTDDFFGRVNKILAITTDLKDLLRKTSLEISKTLKASQAFFYILTDNGKIGAAGTAESSTLAEADLLNLFSYASKKGQITVATLLEDNDPVKKLLSDNKIEIALPLMKGKKLVGLFLMGENMSSNYTGRDISVLETLSNGLVVAILNALAVQEIRDFNVTLRHKIDEATKELRVKNAMLKKLDKAKDEFVSMASHQLRTPLTSVKGYLSMVVDGDAGKVTKQQKELLDEAYVSNEKMVNLVNDFLNVSRIQTGKFMLEKLPIDLSKLVDQEVKGLVQNAKKRGIKLAYRADKDIPSLMVDEGKIRQVVMNYIDNAIYYSHQDSTIKIDLVVDKDEIVFTVKDTGIGVPISEQAGLFTKFYRASNAKKQRPDGTGVGLYLAKKIVSAHDGKIIFKTVEGQGSTFGFSLPIKELKV